MLLYVCVKQSLPLENWFCMSRKGGTGEGGLIGASKGVNNLLPCSVQGQFLISVLAKAWYHGVPPHYSASKIINYAMCGSGVTAIDSALCVKRIAILGLVTIQACFSGRYATDLHV